MYDGSTDASLTIGADNRFSGDALIQAATARFASQNAAHGIAVQLGGAALSGADAGNYSLQGLGAGLVANITPKALGMAGVLVSGKVYDGSDVASATPGTLTGLVGSETLLASVASARFGDAHAGVNKDVSLVFALADGGNGGLAGNYSLAPLSASADISRRPVAVAADAQQKNQGQTDPALSYRAEAPSTGRGLLASEQLSGSLSRAAGEAAGSYAIGQGGLLDANNPDYAIAYQGADLRITAAPQNAPLTPPLEPAAAQPPQIVLDDTPPVEVASRSERTSRTDGAKAGILVTLVRETALQADGVVQDGLIQVRVPREATRAGQGFNFPLPTMVAEQAGPDATFDIRTLSGEPLPTWLRYLPESHRFVAVEVPLGALPLQLLLRAGNRQWVVVIEERAN